MFRTIVMYEWTNAIKRKKWKIQSWLFVEPADAEIFQTQCKIPQQSTEQASKQAIIRQKIDM